MSAFHAYRWLDLFYDYSPSTIASLSSTRGNDSRVNDPTQPTRVVEGIRLRAYHLLIFVAPIGMLGGVPFANGVRTLPFGLPFLLVWIAAWVIATSVCMAVLYALDGRRTDSASPDSAGSP